METGPKWNLAFLYLLSQFSSDFHQCSWSFVNSIFLSLGIYPENFLKIILYSSKVKTILTKINPQISFRLILGIASMRYNVKYSDFFKYSMEFCEIFKVVAKWLDENGYEISWQSLENWLSRYRKAKGWYVPPFKVADTTLSPLKRWFFYENHREQRVIFNLKSS